MNQEPVQCVYCGAQASTRDHTPPKTLFPRALRNNLLTVPACHDCNQGASLDEEYFRAVMLRGACRDTIAGEQVWQESLARAYARNTRLPQRVENSIRYAPGYSPAGLLIGVEARVRFEEQRFQAVVQKIVRGLYFHEFGSALDPARQIRARRLHNEALLIAAAKICPQLLPGSKGWAGVFRYRYNRRKAEPERSMWLLNFYDTEHFWLVTGSKEDIARGELKARLLHG